MFFLKIKSRMRDDASISVAVAATVLANDIETEGGCAIPWRRVNGIDVQQVLVGVINPLKAPPGTGNDRQRFSHHQIMQSTIHTDVCREEFDTVGIEDLRRRILDGPDARFRNDSGRSSYSPVSPP